MHQQELAGRYALRERVGTGGMADVFVARDTRLERDVAVKLFRPEAADGLDRGSAEARLLAGLDHPGLVRVLDMDSSELPGDKPYLVMELIDGPDLGVLLRTHGPLGREDVRLMALDLVRTLQYIHGRGIVHRDIKPSNVLTRRTDPHSGLFDDERMTASGQVIGSAAYFSPEQARGDGVGQASDIYSLGLLMIEALTGERAFPGTGVEGVLARLHRCPSIPHAAGPALSALLISMTLDIPEDRPDAAGLLHTLTVMGPQQQVEALATESLPTSLFDPATVEIAVPAMADSATPDSAEASEPEPDSGSGSGSGSGSAFGSASGSAALDTGSQTRVADAALAAVRPAPQGRRRTVLPWLVTLLVVASMAVAVWAFTALSAAGPAPDVEPLPAVPGEPGVKLEELYESVQQ